MQEAKYNELEERSAELMLREAELMDVFKRAEAETRVHDVIAQMKEEGKALLLTDEEERMLKSFRRFKTRMRKNGEVFKWQTAIEPGVIISQETGLVADPQEIA